MLEERNFSAKMFNVKIKHGWTEDDFVNYYQMSSREELEARMKKEFLEAGYRSMKNRMSQNEKRKKRTNNMNQATNTNSDVNEYASVTIKEEKTLDEIFREKEELLQKEVIEQEGNIAEKRIEIKKLENGLFSEMVKLDQLKKLVERHKNVVEETINQINEKKKVIDNMKEQVKRDKEELQNVRNELEKLRKISIFAYKNGEIEGSEIDISETVTTELLSQALNNPEMEELTVRSIKQLVKLQMIIKSLQAENKSYEIIFEDATVEQVFNKVLKKCNL